MAVVTRLGFDVGIAIPPENRERRGLKILCLLGHRITNTEAFMFTARRWGYSCTGRIQPRLAGG